MKIVIVTAIFRRHDLAAIVLDYYRTIRQQSKHTIELIAVGSEGVASQVLCESNGWGYIEYPNAPLSQKFNALFEATKQHNPDLVVLIGSDDLISANIIEWYGDNIKPEEKNLVGLADLYFYSIQREELLYFAGYGPPSPRTIGAGRCFSRYVLETMQYRPWQNEHCPRGLDSASTRQMSRRGIGEVAYPMSHFGGIGVDVKHPHTTLTSFDRIAQKHLLANMSIVSDAFPVQFAQLSKLKRQRVYQDLTMYEIDILDPRHHKYGKRISVCGKVARDYAERGIIADE